MRDAAQAYVNMLTADEQIEEIVLVDDTSYEELQLSVYYRGRASVLPSDEDDEACTLRGGINRLTLPQPHIVILVSGDRVIFATDSEQEGLTDGWEEPVLDALHRVYGGKRMTVWRGSERGPELESVV